MDRTAPVDRPATGDGVRRSRRARRPTLLIVLTTVLAVLAAGTVWAVTAEGPALRGLRILVPNASGGGYDATARAAAKAMEDSGVTGRVEVFGLPGAGGVVGLGRVVSEHGNDRLVLSMGLGLVGAARSQGTPELLSRTTPIARLTRESEVVVVPADSPFRDLGRLLDAWRSDPAGNAVGGGSTPGGPDHLATMLMAERAGIAPPEVDYVQHDGGGELLAALVSDEVAFAVSGLGELADQVDNGALRVLAVTGGERVPGIDAPTLRETGIDLEFTNWRGILAPPGLTPAQRGELETAWGALVRTPEWREVLRRNNWQDAYQPGPEFGAFLADEERRVAGVLAELGLR
ncbi:Bug family tripartite tricarboxylate transporter substrate binding protein [Pseudonocardia sp. HH130630-07]|uniref:Bug family tripartite tricarboxylate transporter substrate binding protein n=1 Tax=Pseudonocardia sp. HH130630-07 TaxID=1690815 RepID=UPI000814E37E|nr:tripartite tricarboxylate transporter substrate binding protein [Pseudonocardia sp. HH130630-07]ANY10169.1 C4-dicarboxylate ABC transporter substrate-binding protein [Pseudonocardia sp. HH130630-07]